MKRWALLVVGLYVLIMAALAIPLVVAAFSEWPMDDVLKAMRMPGEDGGLVAFVTTCWIWIAVMAICQIGLLVVPVRLARRRPVTKRWIVWPIVTSIFLTLLMFAGAFMAVAETVEHTPDGHAWKITALVSSVIGAWLVWAFLLGFYSGAREPRTFMGRLAKFLVAGSILELLIAVPTHVLARQRDYCCAGFGTFWGLAVGFSVMLMAFGPGVFVLFTRRYQSVKTGR